MNIVNIMISLQCLRHNMNNNEKNGRFYAENSRNGCADISLAIISMI